MKLANTFGGWLQQVPTTDPQPSREGSDLHEEVKKGIPEPVPFHDDARETRKRPFLPRPLGQEDAPDPWEVWTPLFDWLIEHHPDHFHAVCDAEDALNRMERQGITSGDAYEAACHDLYVKFETARQVWIQ